MNQLTAKNKIIEMYSGTGWKSIFAKIRFWDAPYEQIENLVPNKGIIVDLGCGEGFFANYLALISKQRTIIGVEIDGNRVKHADRGISNTTFIKGDITKKQISNADVIIIVHVLHHLLSYKQQEELIIKCKNKLRKKGKLIIVEVEPKLSLKYAITWFTDHFLVPWLFEGRFYSPIYFRKSRDWQQLLISLGFSQKIHQAEQNKPFTHIIFECIKNSS